MKSRFRIRWIDVLVLLAIVGYAGYRGAHRPPKPAVDEGDFAGQVNLDPLFCSAVQADGRLRSFESHAKTFMGLVTGPRQIHGHSNGFTYLDLIFRPEIYEDVDLIYVKHKEVRSQILKALGDHPQLSGDRLAAIEKSGLFARKFLEHPPVVAVLQRLGQDLIRTSKAVDAIQSGIAVSDARLLEDQLRLIAPPSGNVNEPWISIGRLASDLPSDNVHAGMTAPKAIEGLPDELRTKLAEAWNRIRNGWRAQDAAKVNAAIVELTSALPTIAPSLYPSAGRLSMESWYFRYKSMTWVWLFYLASVVPLLMSVVYKWDRARAVGIFLFAIAFLAQTASVGVRWYISGRWPNANMFEAVTTAAWFGGVAALVLEYVARKTPFRNLFALGSAVVSMAALMAAYFLPAQLDSGINNKMAALNDVWLYIHTNVIIWSYAVIGLACIPALLLLRHRWVNLWESGAVPRMRLLILPIALAVLNYTGYLLLMHVIANEQYGLQPRAYIGTLGAMWGSLMIVLLEAMAARARSKAGHRVERSASGGAAALLGTTGGGAFLRHEKPSTGQVYDGATMILVELSFIMLWAGIVMGAIWADHSWGRPWGWDPKETFALNTFLIFLILIHVRLKVRDKAFWTAVIAVAGFEVMMFNWIVVNFVISGLHSYA
jgi:cytochrome c-type biogenesis protein CcsB